MAYKQCIVPHCGNDTIKTPNKIFLNVPSNPIRKKQWFDKITETFGVTYNRQLVQCHCCEDHFELAEDSDNWMWHRMMGGGRITLKHHVVPHIFNKKSTDSQFPSTEEKLKRENGLFDEEIQIKAEAYMVDTEEIPEYDSLQARCFPDIWTNTKNTIDANAETSMTLIKVKEEVHDWSNTELRTS